MTIMDVSLLDMMQGRAGCERLDDLYGLEPIQKQRIARRLSELPAEATALFAWNDALQYLARYPPEQTAQAARKRLMQSLSRPQQAGPAFGKKHPKEKIENRK